MLHANDMVPKDVDMDRSLVIQMMTLKPTTESGVAL